MRLRSLAAAVVMLALFAAGCSGSGAPDDSDTQPASAPAPAATGQKPPGPPAISETIDAAVRRIDDVVSSGDCEQIGALNPLTRPKMANPSRCEVLKGLAGLQVKRAAAYGGVAGVVDYVRGDRIVSVLLVGDRDGLFHVAYIDAFRGTPSVGTERVSDLDSAAERAVRALRQHDCAAFLEAAYRRFGFAGGTDAEVCERVKVNPLAGLEPRGQARLERLGGNGHYAFYGLDTPSSYLTLITAQQTEAGVPETMPERIAALPNGAPAYGFVDAFRTNPR
jgi:hypothetical protein